MIIRQISILIVLVVLTLSCSQQRYIKTKWQKTEYQQDEGIPRTSFWYDKKEKVMYLVTNDTENLYIHMKIYEISAVRKILDFGFTVWIDVNGKNKKNRGVQFPLPQSDRMSTLQFDINQDKKRGEGRERRPSLDKNYNIGLIGFNNTGEKTMNVANDDSHIEGLMRFNESQELEYSLKIPFHEIGLINNQNKIISLNMESGASKVESQNRGPGGSGSSRGPGGSGGLGGAPGGMQGGHGGGRQGGAPQMQQSQDMTTPLKIKIKKIELLFEESQNK